LLGILWVGRKLLSCSKYLIILPGFIIFFEGPVERSKLASNYELGYDCMVPVAGTGVHALGH
jgi:hypothetical protein